MKLKIIIQFLQQLNSAQRQLYTEVLKLILVMPATNAVSERTFSALRRLKTWLRKYHASDTVKLVYDFTLHKMIQIC